MIKPEELRIGNFIKAWYEVYRVNIILIDSIIHNYNYYNINEGFEQVSMENIEPIELTEEWLLKFGFKQHDKWLWKFFIDEELYLFVVKFLGNIEIGIDINNKKTYTKNKYVHQIQNLYFALTGSELTIKE